MPHETSLIATIAVSLAFAFVGGFIAVRLRLPPLVGYLLAGMAVGPFTPGFVADAKLISELAEIGVILLMFGVGLHFSPRDLFSVRAVAAPVTILQIAAMMAVGVMIGWPLAARFCAVFQAFSDASSTTVTPPSARSRAASRAIERCGSASMIVEGRPQRCQWTARQLAKVLLPLPPFIVATVIICLISHLPFRLISVWRIACNQCYRIFS